MPGVRSLYGTLNTIQKEHQRCANKPAQGKRGTSAALGIRFYSDKAVNGRRKLSRPFGAFGRFHLLSQGVALGWLVRGLWLRCKMEFLTGSSVPLKY